MRAPCCQLTMVGGGKLLQSDGGLAAEFLAQFEAGIAIIGAFAGDMDGDFLAYNLAEIRVLRSILARTRSAFVVADHSKLTRSAPARIGSLADAARFFKDAP